MRLIRAIDTLVILTGGGACSPTDDRAKSCKCLQSEKVILAIAADGEVADPDCRSGPEIVVAPDAVGAIPGKALPPCAVRALGRLEAKTDRAFISGVERQRLARQRAAIAVRRA
jgi:hypothetical protein